MDAFYDKLMAVFDAADKYHSPISADLKLFDQIQKQVKSGQVVVCAGAYAGYEHQQPLGRDDFLQTDSISKFTATFDLRDLNTITIAFKDKFGRSMEWKVQTTNIQIFYLLANDVVSATYRRIENDRMSREGSYLSM